MRITDELSIAFSMIFHLLVVFMLVATVCSLFVGRPKLSLFYLALSVLALGAIFCFPSLWLVEDGGIAGIILGLSFPLVFTGIILLVAWKGWKKVRLLWPGLIVVVLGYSLLFGSLYCLKQNGKPTGAHWKKSALHKQPSIKLVLGCFFFLVRKF